MFFCMPYIGRVLLHREKSLFFARMSQDSQPLAAEKSHAQ